MFSIVCLQSQDQLVTLVVEGIILSKIGPYGTGLNSNLFVCKHDSKNPKNKTKSINNHNMF